MSRKKPKNHILVKLARKRLMHGNRRINKKRQSFFAKTLDPVWENSTKCLDLHHYL
jgi:hypothetical protein